MPIDGGLSLLLAAGAAYGARRLRRRRDWGIGEIQMKHHLRQTRNGLALFLFLLRAYRSEEVASR
jgi:hypothetical protein